MTESSHISRRRVVHAATWAAPAIVLATAAPALAASIDNPLEGTTVSPPVSQGNRDAFVVTVSLPPDVTITGATFALTWDRTGSTNASVAVDSNGTPWSPPSSSTSPAVFVCPVVLGAGSTFNLVFSNGRTGSTWSGTLSGVVNGVEYSVTLTGVL